MTMPAGSSATTAGGANISNNYTNVKEHNLPELRIYSAFLEEALKAVLHTLLFVRAPADVRPVDAYCEKLAPIIYATCGLQDLDNKINTTIELLKRSFIISPSGQHLRGEITLSFYQRKESKSWFQFVPTTEHVYFERWRVPVTILDYQPPANSPPSSLTMTPPGHKLGASPGMLSASTFSPSANNNMNSNNNNNNYSNSQRRHSTGGPGTAAGSTTGTAGIGFFQSSPTNHVQPENADNSVASGNTSNNTSNNSAVSNVDPMKAYLHAYDLVTKAIMFILETANMTTLPILVEQACFELNVSDAKELRQSAAYLANSNKSLNSNIAAGKISPMVPSSNSRR